jgi:CO dehydrogenase nickel-insertion accessory protein CooC1
LLGQLERHGRVVVADLEAGLGTLLRLDRPVDVVVVVVEPTVKSLEVGRRAAETVRAAGLGRVVVAANRVRDEADAQRVRDAFPVAEVQMVPDDPAVEDAERRGSAPLDAAPDAPAVRALVALAESLAGSVTGPPS